MNSNNIFIALVALLLVALLWQTSSIKDDCDKIGIFDVR